MELFREIIHIERVGKMTFDFLHCRADILEIQRVLRPGKAGAELGKACQELKASDGERSIVDIETLQHTNEQLVSTLDEVVNIQREGAQKRKEAEVELGRIEGELKQKLMELRS